MKKIIFIFIISSLAGCTNSQLTEENKELKNEIENLKKEKDSLLYVTLKNDQDTNIIKTVTIESQTWMIENLNTDTFRNGDLIPEVKTKEEWVKFGNEGKPAWCYQENNFDNGLIYGKLYNYYAVSDPRMLAPKGWHIPSEAEWLSLIYHKVNGFQMKKVDNRKDINSFSGSLGGMRTDEGRFFDFLETGIWWSSNNTYAHMDHDHKYSYGNIYKISDNRNYGFSIRCIKD